MQMHTSLCSSDTLYTSVSLLRVPHCLISVLFSPPVHSIQASSLYTQETIQMDATNTTQNYKWKKICPFKVRKENRNIEQFLINHLQLHAKSGTENPLSCRTRMKGLVSCRLCSTLLLLCPLSISLSNKHSDGHTTYTGSSSLAPKTPKTQYWDSPIPLGTQLGEIQKDPTELLSIDLCMPSVPTSLLPWNQYREAEAGFLKWFVCMKM